MNISCEKIEFSYNEKKLIKNLNLDVFSGEHIWIRGKSGSGKSSLLKIIAGSLEPRSGHIQIGEIVLNKISLAEKTEFRSRHIGYVHQENHLIDHWTVEQNLKLVQQETNHFSALLKDLNLDLSIQTKLVAELSGGEKQRVSLARLLLQKPKLALLDEPTSHLDDSNASQILSLVQQRLSDSTVIFVSHDARLEKLKMKTIEFSEINQ